jgi:hypothetical protein
MCEQIAAFKPDVVVTEKGLSDIAAFFLTKVLALTGGWVLRCRRRLGTGFAVEKEEKDLGCYYYRLSLGGISSSISNF